MSAPRNELKFYISSASATLLEHRMSAILQRDSHIGKNGSYQIRSLYFDDLHFSAFFDKINGLEKRAKYRIRYYNNNLDYIRLEKKEKIGNRSYKTAVPISLSFVEGLLRRDLDSLSSGESLSEEFLHRIHSERFRPVLFVDYIRKAFLYPAGNVRITLDSNLTVSRFSSTLSDGKGAIPVLQPGEVILEVKFDSFLPPHIAALFEDIPKINCSFSKYCKCFEMIF